MIRFLLCLLLGSAPVALIAGDIHVSPGASDAFASAIGRAAPGDHLIVQPGVYREWLVISKPITITALEGAVLDGSVPFKAEWKPAPADLEHVYVASVKRRPRGLLMNGKFVAEIRRDQTKDEGEWNWRTLLRRGPPLSGFDQIRALWMYNPDEGRVYARFENAAAPSALDLSLLDSSDAQLKITKTDHVVVDGLAFRGGAIAVEISEGASDCAVRNCRVQSFERRGIVLTGGAKNCAIEGCDITRGAVEEWTPSLEHSRPNYEIWRIHKDVGNKDRPGIELIRAGVGNRILRNHVQRTFDGICLGDYEAESLDAPAADPEQGRGTEIAENVIENTRDSGIELGVGCVDVNVHHNILRRTHGGLRFKVPRAGPVYIHHNRLIDGSPFNIWFSMDSSPAEGYIYHNTILRGDAGLIVSLKGSKQTFTAPKWHFLNNLVLSKEGFVDQYGGTPPLDFTTSHNVCTGSRRPWPKDPARDPGSLYDTAIDHDENGRPAKGSAAIDAGLDLSTYLNGRKLPGCEPGYFRGSAPDVGADEVE